MKIPKSKTGLAFAGIYFFVAVIMFWDISDCVGFLCDLEAYPVVLPFGIVCIYIVKALDTIYFFGTSYTTYRWSDFAFVIPTMLGNIVFYYWFGVFVSWVVKKIIPNK